MLSFDGLEASVAVLATVLNWNSKLLVQGSHQPGKSGRVRESQGIWVVRESQGKVREFWMESGKKKKRRKNGK